MKTIRRTLAWGWLLAFAGCDARSAPLPPANEPHLRYGALMMEVGQRFERAGRAASAGRFELAAFESNEIGELFTEDLPHADVPKEGLSMSLPAMAAAFAQTYPGKLKRAARSHDLASFRAAFKEAATACNTCHQASGHGFVEVPETLNAPVPVIELTQPTGVAPAHVP